MMTCKEKAIEWGVSIRTVNNLCKKGKIPGVEKRGTAWYIPDDGVSDIWKYGNIYV